MSIPLHQRLVLALALLLALAATMSLSRGVYLATSTQGTFDLTARGIEYRLFSEGVYPNNLIASNALPGEILPGSVYPPYAFPMFAPFFALGSPSAAAIIFGILTAAALVAIGVFGFRELETYGPSAGLLGAVAGIAIAHNSSVIAFGQFSIISMGCVVLQLRYLQRGKVMLAGLLWALAMLKPQIALVFALPFLVHHRWRGLAFGLSILLLLSWFTLIHTRASALAVLDYWLLRENFAFIIAGGSFQGSSAGGVLAALGVGPRFALSVSLLTAFAMTILAWLRRGREQSWTLGLIAICAIVGRVFIPHRAYDNIMLFPALIAILAIALARRSVGAHVLAALFGISVWLPLTSLVRSAWLDATLLAFWLATAAFLLLGDASARPRPLQE